MFKVTKLSGLVALALLLASCLPNRADAGVVRMLAERNVPSTGSDFFLLSYPSLADAVAGTGLTQQALPLPLSDPFSISGMFLDAAGQLLMLAERNVPSTGSDFFLLSYPSLAEAVAGTGLTQQALPLPLSDPFSISGMFLDAAGQLFMLAERDTPSTGSDFFLLSYPSLADAVAGTGLTQQALPLPLSDPFSISGMFIESDPNTENPDSNEVPEPPVVVLVAGGLALCGAMRRRGARRRKTASGSS